MVSRDSENRGVVILVRFVKLHRIIAAYPVEVDDISQMIKEERFLRGLMLRAAILDLFHHHSSQPLLSLCAMDPTTVSDRVKDHCLVLCNPGIRSGQDNIERNTQVNIVS